MNRILLYWSARVSRLLLGILPLVAISWTRAVAVPNGPDSRAEPGWTQWRPSTEAAAANYSAGFSNIELGGFLDFQASCARAYNLPEDQTPPYWFRLTHSVQRIGTGQIEYGCWKDGQQVTGMTMTAISTSLGNVDCLRVTVPEGLNIRAEPGLQARLVGQLSRGDTVTPDSFPASMTNADGRDWVAIQSPQKGWVSNDRPERSGNLALCGR